MLRKDQGGGCGEKRNQMKKIKELYELRKKQLEERRKNGGNEEKKEGENKKKK